MWEIIDKMSSFDRQPSMKNNFDTFEKLLNEVNEQTANIVWENRDNEAKPRMVQAVHKNECILVLTRASC